MYKRGNKKGQVTLFIIIGIVIVAVVLLAIFLVPRISRPTTPQTSTLNPGAYISSCVTDEVLPILSKLSKQGGYLDPSPYYTWYGNNLQFLCYSENETDDCVNQKPMLKEDIENQLLVKVDSITRSCINSFKLQTENKGDIVTTCGTLLLGVALKPESVTIDITCPIKIVTKEDENLNFNDFDISIDSNLYGQVMLAKDVVNEEIVGNGVNFAIQYASTHDDILLNSRTPTLGIRVYNITYINDPSDNEFLFAIKNPKYV
ncbi:MAG: hypothetical protein NTX24_04690 [Candidatus Pacearchaeota archaeon]|nr:hypothetical protein [Candidatus Pacearchaeota archaeon]